MVDKEILKQMGFKDVQKNGMVWSYHGYCCEKDFLVCFDVSVCRKRVCFDGQRCKRIENDSISGNVTMEEFFVEFFYFVHWDGQCLGLDSRD